MSEGLTLLVMGPLEIRGGGAPLSLPAKTQALLVYLAMTGRRGRREALADMFWGETGDDSARANLRLALTKLRQALPGVIDADADSVGLVESSLGDVDALQMQQIVNTLLLQPPDRQEAAAALYRGPFLHDFVLRDCAAFEDWVNAERQRIDRRVVVLLRELVQGARRAAKTTREIGHLSVWARIEPWNEEVQLPLVRLLAQSGATAAALDSFEACRRAMAEELGVRPSAALAALADQVRRGELPQLAVAGSPVVATPPARAVRSQTLYGRDEDLRLVQARIGQGERLIMLLGPAGVGKSSLAAELAGRVAAHYPDGQVTCSFDFMERDGNEQARGKHFVGVLGTALGLGLTLTAQPMAMLKTHLATRRVVLVLDGFEACIEATPVLAELLLAAPGCLFLVTSRMRLPLAYGWVHELRGLGIARQGERDPALAMLLSCARRNGVDIGAADDVARADLRRLVEVLDGSPLAIQFAAQSLRVLSAAQLVRKLEEGAWLDSSMHLPEYRYDRLQDVMDDMWGQLEPDLQGAWTRCAQFKGLFDLEWAQDCAGVSDRLLALLMERSILSREGHGYLRMHELTRQHGLRMLDQLPDAQAVRRAFARAALARLVARSDLLLREDTGALDALQPELATLAAAFDQVLQWAPPQDIQAPLVALQRMYHRLGWHHAAARLLDAVLARHADAPPAWRIIWHYMAGTVVHNQFGYQGETAHFTAAVALSGLRPPASRARAWPWALGRLALVPFARPAAQALERDAQRALTHCLIALVLPLYIHGEPPSVLLAYLCAAALAARRSGHADARLAVRVRTLAIDQLRRLPRLQAALSRSARRCLPLVDPVHEAFAQDLMVIVFIGNGQWDEAVVRLRRASRMLASLGYGYDALECEGRRNMVLQHQGDFGQLLAEVSRAELEARRIQQPTILRWTLLFKMQAWLRTGQGTAAAASECLRAVHAIAVRRVRLEETRIAAHEALLLATLGDTQGVLQRAGEILPRMGQSAGRIYSLAPLAVLLDAVLHVATAEALSSPAARGMALQLVRSFARVSRNLDIFSPRRLLYLGVAAALSGNARAAGKFWHKGLRDAGIEGLPYDRARLHWMLSLYDDDAAQPSHAQAAAGFFKDCGVLGPNYPYMPQTRFGG